MASPFWSAEQQQQFLEQQAVEVSRPVDLERYEVPASRGNDDEATQQASEPPYGDMGSTLLDKETRQLISDDSREGQGEARGRSASTVTGPTQLARIETRVDESPGRRSLGYESLQSQQSQGSKLEPGFVRTDQDEQELVPDYSQLPQLSTPPGVKAPEATTVPAESPTSSMQLVMAQMSSMMSHLIQEQLGPTLNQMMAHQARVESRLEMLESSSGESHAWGCSTRLGCGARGIAT